QLIGMPGQNGRMLDIAHTLQALKDNTAGVATSRELMLVTISLPPDITNPAPYLEQAKAVTEQPFHLVAYDPFTDQHLTFSTDQNTITSWLEAGANGLTLRARPFQAFVDAQNNALQNDTANGGSKLRYIEVTEAADKMRNAITNGLHSLDLRIRY